MLRLTLAECEAYGVSFENAKGWARPFSARILQAGLVSYRDQNRGVSRLRHETIAKFANSFVGRPVVCAPKVMENGKVVPGKYVHQRTTPENMKQMGHGYVTEVFFNTTDGWWWAKGIVDTEDAQRAIKEVGRCSCSYTGVTEKTPGKLNDLPYDNEVVEFSGTHLAIVHNPRYEDAQIFLNSKEATNPPMNLLKMFRKKPAATAADPKTGAETPAQTLDNGLTEITPDTKITVVDAEGKSVETTIGEIANAYATRDQVDPTAELEVEGQRVTVQTLIDGHKARAVELQNAKETQEKAEKDATEKARLAKEQIDNAKRPDHFKLVLTAAQRPAAAAGQRPNFGSLDEGVAEGKAMFGTPEAAKA